MACVLLLTRKEDNKYHGYGGIALYPKSMYPDDAYMPMMEFEISDTGFGTELKNKGLMSALFSVLAEARDKGWLGNNMHVHMGLGTKAWGKLARKFKFDWYGLHPEK